jgi:hypothetical protein
VISSSAAIWFMLALVSAFFATAIAQMRGLVWWNGLVVAAVSILAVGILPIKLASLAREAMLDPLTFLAVMLVLFTGYQFSLFIGKLVGKFWT